MITVITRAIGWIKLQYNLRRIKKIMTRVFKELIEYEKSADWMTKLNIRNAQEEFFKKTGSARTKEDLKAALVEFRSRLEEILV